MRSIVLREYFLLKMKYYVKISKKMTNDSYISNLKVVTVFSVHLWSFTLFFFFFCQNELLVPKIYSLNIFCP